MICHQARLRNRLARLKLILSDGAMTTKEEVVGIVVRDTKIFSENVQSGVEYLNTVRHMLQEYDPVNRHTRPMTGDLVE